MLPEKLPVLTRDLVSTGASFVRVAADAEIGGYGRLREANYDRLIINFLDSVSNALARAGVLREGSKLLHLRGQGSGDQGTRQILRIDVLCAEVDEKNGTFRRFVIFEDKLARNPEAHRDVIGQILDYQRALGEMDFDSLAELLHEDHQPWLTANDDLIGDALRDRDFLLVLSCDRVPPRLLDYLQHLAGQMNPMVVADFAALSLALFASDNLHILVPHVELQTTAERSSKIRIIVEDTNGRRLTARAAQIESQNDDASMSRSKLYLADLRDAIREVGGDSAVQVADDLFDQAKKHGAEVVLKQAAASVRVRNTSRGRHSTLFVVTRKATFYVGWLNRWRENAGVPEDLSTTYLARLTSILGRSPFVIGTGGTNAVPLSVVGQKMVEVEAAIAEVVPRLRGDVAK